MICGLLLTILASTSSTAYASILVFSLTVLLRCLSLSMHGSATSRQMTYIGLAFLVLPLILMATMLLPGAWNAITTLFDATVVNKLDSQLGVERMRWNEQALLAFSGHRRHGGWVESMKLEFHRGSGGQRWCARHLAVWCAFLVRMWRSPAMQAGSRTMEATVMRAGGVACPARFIAATINAGGVDLGIFFSIAAGLASSFPSPHAQLHPGGAVFSGHWQSTFRPADTVTLGDA